MKKKLNCLLLIDDDTATNYLNTKIVKQVDCADYIKVATSGQQALDYLSNSGTYAVNGDVYPRPDLIFLDLNMPMINGVQCLRELKKDPELRSVPVVIYTSSKSYDERAETLKLGANYFITKPPSFRQICKVVSDILAREINQN